MVAITKVVVAKKDPWSQAIIRVRSISMGIAIGQNNIGLWYYIGAVMAFDDCCGLAVTTSGTYNGVGTLFDDLVAFVAERAGIAV